MNNVLSTSIYFRSKVTLVYLFNNFYMRLRLRV